jgi:integrase
VLTQVMTAAVDDRMISSTPCRPIRLPKSDDGEVVPPTVEQVTALADAIGDRWRAVVVTLAGWGLRIGELLGLSVSDVDFLRREIRVERQRSQAGALVPVKSKSSRRTVPVGQVVIDELAAHLAAFPSTGALFVDEVGEPLLGAGRRSPGPGSRRRTRGPLRPCALGSRRLCTSRGSSRPTTCGISTHRP